MFKKLRNWYWRHWEAFDLIESIFTSREAKLLATFFTTTLGLIFFTKGYFEAKLGISLVNNQPITDIWFLSIFFGFSIGIFMMIFLNHLERRI